MTQENSGAAQDATKEAADTAPGAAGESRPIDVVSLYAHDMNIYGDSGNVLVIEKRLRLYGYEPVVHLYNPGDLWPEHVDLVLGGGGQDSGQRIIQKDFLQRGGILRQLAKEGVPMLMICGLYQLFGKYFQTVSGDRIPGVGVFDAVTIGKKARLIGNVVERSSDFGIIVGYENHSGQTFLHGDTKPLATVSKGQGNNLDDGFEGARVGNVIGTYMHGSLLPKNPRVADFLIARAAEHRYGTFEPRISREARHELDLLDRTAREARDVARQRPR